jgi:hypothetical protein
MQFLAELPGYRKRGNVNIVSKRGNDSGLLTFSIDIRQHLIVIVLSELRKTTKNRSLIGTCMYNSDDALVCTTPV